MINYGQKNPIKDAYLTLNIEVDKLNTNCGTVLSMVESISPEANARRIDQHQDRLSVTALLKVKNIESTNRFSEEFQEKFPKGSISFIDDSSMPNV